MKGELIMLIGEKLKEGRKQNNLTQEQVSEKLHISRQTISNWETGNRLPDIVNIIVLSDLYNMSLDNLLKGDIQIMHKLEKEQQALSKHRKIIWLNILAIPLVLITLLSAFLYQTSHISLYVFEIIMIISFVLIMLVGAATSYLTGIETVGKEPLFIKKEVGLGTNINPRNIWGLILYMLIPIVLIIIVWLSNIIH